jgi:hypothetical protein
MIVEGKGMKEGQTEDNIKIDNIKIYLIKC